MYTQPTTHQPIIFSTIPVIDAEFDRFDVREDLENSLREMEFANFYHGAFDTEE